MIVLRVVVRICPNLLQSLPCRVWVCVIVGVAVVTIVRVGVIVWVAVVTVIRVGVVAIIRVGAWSGIGNFSVSLRTVGLTLSELVTYTSFVVVTSRHSILSLIAHWSALNLPLPRLLPIAWNITSAACWESSLILAADIALSR